MTVTYNQPTTRHRTAALWKGFASINDPTKTKHFFDDFMTGGGAVAGNSGWGPYAVFSDDALGISAVADEIGAVAINSGATADDSTVMTTNTAPFTISDGTSSDPNPRLLVFEARFKVEAIADGDASFFVGLTEEDRDIDSGLFTDAQASADIDQIGFRRLDADGDVLEFFYKTAGQTLQVVYDAHTLVAGTYVKIGFISDPSAPASQRIVVWKNGVPVVASYVTGTDIAAVTFPDGDLLAMTAGIKTDDSAAHALTLDWWECAQLI